MAFLTNEYTNSLCSGWNFLLALKFLPETSVLLIGTKSYNFGKKEFSTCIRNILILVTSDSYIFIGCLANYIPGVIFVL